MLKIAPEIVDTLIAMQGSIGTLEYAKELFDRINEENPRVAAAIVKGADSTMEALDNEEKYGKISEEAKKVIRYNLISFGLMSFHIAEMQLEVNELKAIYGE